MESVFTLANASDGGENLNMDDLYEYKQQKDMEVLATFNKILSRIHTKVKAVSRQQGNPQFCWYVIPEMLIGVPTYDAPGCAAYLISKLRDNGFIVRYTHPNLLFVSWKHWIPSYVRGEIKKKTGVNLDGYGNKIAPKNKNNDPSNPYSNDYNNPNALLTNRPPVPPQNAGPAYTPIEKYTPSGKMIYNSNLLQNIEDRTRTIPK